MVSRARRVLEVAFRAAGWGHLGARHSLGVAVQSAFGGLLATIAVVVAAADGTVSVPRVVAAVDCGEVGKAADPLPRCVDDGVGDRRRYADEGGVAERLRAERIHVRRP